MYVSIQYIHRDGLYGRYNFHPLLSYNETEILYAYQPEDDKYLILQKHQLTVEGDVCTIGRDHIGTTQSLEGAVQTAYAWIAGYAFSSVELGKVVCHTPEAEAWVEELKERTRQQAERYIERKNLLDFDALKARKISVGTKFGGSIKVMAKTRGEFAAHRTVNGKEGQPPELSKKQWTVTHIPTGLAAIQGVTREEALAVVNQLATHIPEKFDTNDTKVLVQMTDLIVQARHIIR